MKTQFHYLHLLIVLIMAVGVLYGCADSPLGDSEAKSDEFLDAVELRAADVEGIDVEAIAVAFDPADIREAIRASESDTKPTTSKASVVGAGESIQAAVDAARPGEIVFIRSGVYEEAIEIDKPLHLVGLGRPGSVVIQDPGGERNGIDARNLSGLSIINLTVRGFSGNGVFFVNVNGFLLFRVYTDQLREGAYGLFPVRSSNGLILRCTATGADDAGIYVGQSENVAVLHSEAFGNVIGFESENTKRTRWAHNRGYGNAAGMLAILLPPSEYISVLHAEQLTVEHNRFTDNNGENFAEEGDLASFVPAGSGLLVIGYDDSMVRRNHVTGNAYIGIGLGSSVTMLTIAGRMPDDPAELEIEPHPDGVSVVRNRVTGNGYGTPTLPLLPAVDLLWDGFGTGNCWSSNTYSTSFPEDLPSCDA